MKHRTPKAPKVAPLPEAPPTPQRLQPPQFLSEITKIYKSLTITSSSITLTPVPSSSTETDAQEYIPRPPNSWVLFRAWGVQHLANIAPGMNTGNVGAVSSFLSGMWAKVTREEKRHYAVLAEEAGHLHQLKYPDYRYQPRRHDEDAETVRKPRRRETGARVSDSQVSGKRKSNNATRGIGNEGDAASASSSASTSHSSTHKTTRTAGHPYYNASRARASRKEKLIQISEEGDRTSPVHPSTSSSSTSVTTAHQTTDNDNDFDSDGQRDGLRPSSPLSQATESASISSPPVILPTSESPVEDTAERDMRPGSDDEYDDEYEFTGPQLFLPTTPDELDIHESAEVLGWQWEWTADNRTIDKSFNLNIPFRIPSEEELEEMYQHGVRSGIFPSGCMLDVGAVYTSVSS